MLYLNYPGPLKTPRNFFEGIFQDWCIIGVVILTITMKTLKMFKRFALIVSLLGLPLAGVAGDTNSARGHSAQTRQNDDLPRVR